MKVLDKSCLFMIWVKGSYIMSHYFSLCVFVEKNKYNLYDNTKGDHKSLKQNLIVFFYKAVTRRVKKVLRLLNLHLLIFDEMIYIKNSLFVEDFLQL